MQTRRYQVEWMLLGTALLVLGALVGYWFYAERDRIEARERDRLQLQARVIDENLGHQLKGLNAALAGVRSELALSDTRGKADDGMSLRLKALADAIPGVRTVTVSDAEGKVLFSNRDELIGNSASALEYFKAARGRPDPATLYVSPPFTTRLGAYSIIVARALLDSSGRFAGTVSAALDPEYFRVVLRSVLYAPDMWTSLAHEDGRIFLFMPPDEKALGADLNRPGSFYNKFRESGQTSSVTTGTSARTGEERMLAQRIVRVAGIHMDKTIGIAVSRKLSAIDAPWRRDVLVDSALFGAMAISSILGLYLSQRSQRKLDRVEAEHARDRREIVERQERALRASVERYRGIYDSLQDVYVETDLDGTILEISPQVEMLSGGHYRREDLLGRSANAFYADPERRAAFLRTLTTQGSTRDFESSFVDRDGSAVPCSISATIRAGADGKPTGIVSMVRDITERKRAEASLRESEERLRAIFEGARDGILVTDVRSGKFLAGNPAICRMLGYTLEEIVRICVADIHPKQDLQHMIEEFKRLQRGESQEVADFPVIRKDRSTFQADMQLAPIRLGETDCALAIVRDISERRQLEEALEESRERFRALSEAAFEAIFISEQGICIEQNKQAQLMFGYSDLEALGRYGTEWIAPEDRDLVMQNMLKGYESAYEATALRKDGTTFPAVLRGKMMHYKGRTVRVTSLRDITERKHAEQERARVAARLREAYRRLAQAQEAERRALTKELHDQVGQNLSALNLNLHIIERELAAGQNAYRNERLDDSLALLAETTERVRDLMGALRPPMLEDFGLDATLRWLAHETTHRSGIECALTGPGPAQRFPAEIETTLVRVAQEALTNAVKYSKARRITVALTVKERQVQLEIADDGVGFDPDQAARSDVKPTWGLMSMRERAAALGGHVRIVSAPGVGARVVANIPLEPA